MRARVTGSGRAAVDDARMANPDDPGALAVAFAKARYHVPELGAAGVLQVGAVAHALEQAVPADSYGFITAWNPDSRSSSSAENARADGDLVAELDALRIRRLRAFASDAQGGHREDGWLVLDAPLAELDRLARGFGQDGVLAWRTGEPARLRLYHAAPSGAAASQPWTDWVG